MAYYTFSGAREPTSPFFARFQEWLIEKVVSIVKHKIAPSSKTWDSAAKLDPFHLLLLFVNSSVSQISLRESECCNILIICFSVISDSQRYL